MKIVWHGHDCFEIAKGIRIITDPHDGKSIGIRPPRAEADLVLVSHDHFDHNCVRAVNKPGTVVVSTSGKTQKMGVDITGIPTYHDEDQGKKRGHNIIFRFNYEDLEMCHLGDLGHMPDDETMSKLKGIDILFLPVGGTFTIDHVQAWELVNKLEPKVVIPMHYRVGGLSLHINPVQPFLDQIDQEIVHFVGNEVGSLSREELSESMEIWVFTL